jgi:hypothetical protein
MGFQARPYYTVRGPMRQRLADGRAEYKILRTEMNIHGMNNAARICAPVQCPLWNCNSAAPRNLRRAVEEQVRARPLLRKNTTHHQKIA